MPDIVYVDDEPDLLAKTAPNADDWNRVQMFKHNEAGEEALAAARDAYLWLFDFFFGDAGPDRSTLEENGLSLFNKWRSELKENRPIAAVVSNHLENALGPLGPERRLHLLAQQAGVEWVGKKSAANINQLIKLADASKSLASSFAQAQRQVPNSGALGISQLCFDILRAPSKISWERSVERQVDRARPPRITPATSGKGLARLLLAWLLHHVLPYPSFLLTDTQAALRLGVTPASFRNLLKSNNALRSALDEANYNGPLADFDGPRWWRAGIDHISWDLSQAEIGYREALANAAGGARADRFSHTERSCYPLRCRSRRNG